MILTIASTLSTHYSNEVLDKHAPIKKVKIRGRPIPYITDEIRELMKSGDRWRKIARRTNNPDAWAAYRNLRNDIKREIRSAERAYARTRLRATLIIQASCGRLFDRLFQGSLPVRDHLAKITGPLQMILIGSLRLLAELLMTRLVPLLMNAISTFLHLRLIQEFLL